MRILFFDTETTGLPVNWDAPVDDLNNWPRLVQLAWQVYDQHHNLIEEKDFIIKPNGFSIPSDATNIHKISNEKANELGDDLCKVLALFYKSVEQAKLLVAHNYNYDYSIMGSEFLRNGFGNILRNKEHICTMKSTVELCKIPGYNGFKWPKIEELYSFLFKPTFMEGLAHNALYDTLITAECFWHIVTYGFEKKISDKFEELLYEEYSLFYNLRDWNSIEISITDNNVRKEIYHSSINKNDFDKRIFGRNLRELSYNDYPFVQWLVRGGKINGKIHTIIEENWQFPTDGKNDLIKFYLDDWYKTIRIQIPEEMCDEFTFGSGTLNNYINELGKTLEQQYNDYKYVFYTSEGEEGLSSSLFEDYDIPEIDLYFFSKKELQKTFIALNYYQRNDLVNKILDAVSKEIFFHCKNKYPEVKENPNRFTYSFSINNNDIGSLLKYSFQYSFFGDIFDKIN
jgi:DNA polymerase III epsilon subunit-like protein